MRLLGVEISAKVFQAKEGKGGQRGLELEGGTSCDWSTFLGL